jgi:hypothetical protein
MNMETMDDVEAVIVVTPEKEDGQERGALTETTDSAGSSDMDIATPSKESRTLKRKQFGRDAPKQEPEIHIGMQVSKQFEDGEYYQGTVVSGPEETERDDKTVLSWRVRYVLEA